MYNFMVNLWSTSKQSTSQAGNFRDRSLLSVVYDTWWSTLAMKKSQAKCNDFCALTQRLNDIYNLKKHPMPCLATGDDDDDDEPKLDKATLFSFGRVGRSWGTEGARDGAG